FVKTQECSLILVLDSTDAAIEDDQFVSDVRFNRVVVFQRCETTEIIADLPECIVLVLRDLVRKVICLNLSLIFRSLCHQLTFLDDFSGGGERNANNIRTVSLRVAKRHGFVLVSPRINSIPVNPRTRVARSITELI